MQLKIGSIVIATLSLLFLGACSSGNQTTSNTNSSMASPAAGSSPALSPSPAASPGKTSTNTKSHGGQGGQVIESGPYHLELLNFKEGNNTHIDFFLQKGDNHEPIPTAKVTAQVQLPDGSQKSLDMKYDEQGKHYVAILPNTTSGEYKVAILTDMNGEKVNGRFSFKQ